MDTPITYSDGHEINYRASALGGCLKRLWASRMQYAPKPPPANMQKVFDEGTELEPIILKKVHDEYDIKLYDHQKEIKFYVGDSVDKPVFIVGHIDACDHNNVPIDAKAFSQSTWDKFYSQGIEAFPYYLWQGWAYAYGMNAPGFRLAIYNKDTEELRIETYYLPDNPLDQFKLRIASVENLLGFDPPSCDNSYPCPFYYLHDAIDKAELPLNAQILLTVYNKLTLKLKSLGDSRKEVSDKLLDELSSRGSSFSHSDYTVSIVDNPKRLDTKAVLKLLEEAEVDSEEFYTPGKGQHIQVRKNQGTP
jgi:hypothetical protein